MRDEPLLVDASRVGRTGEHHRASLAQFASDVQYYLTLNPRQLPSRYFYDSLGSALFDVICRLPWYRITRAELRLLNAHGRDLFGRLARVSTLVELGPGNGEKLAMLIERGRDRGPGKTDGAAAPARPLTVHLVDVSSDALEAARRTLARMDRIQIVTHQKPYELGLIDLARGARPGDATLALFLGSNIGNFDPPGAEAFLRGIRAALVPGDGLLLGTDLVKAERDLLLAYDDPLGVTGAFNLNLLVRVNRELGGDFDIGGFGHRAVWNAAASRVEMHLVSRRRQRVRVEASALELTIEDGESIWTESSYKYHADEVVRTLEHTGFSPVDQWIDAEDGFALTLVSAV